MAVFRIQNEEADYLAEHYEETAMGYQVLEGAFDLFNRTMFLALNAEFILPFTTLTELRRVLSEISEWSEDDFPERAEPVYIAEEPSLAAQLSDLRIVASLLNPDAPLEPRLDDVIARQQISSKRVVRQPSLYFRFSAFRRDRRVMPNGGLLPGTYATTFNDLRMVPSGYAAVGRYALPSTLPARYVFPIVTGASPVYVGTATPNFGQAGGGVEVLFVKGASHLPGVPHQGPDE